jgi:hypothetical protein
MGLTEVVDEREETSTEKHCEGHSSQGVSVLKETRRKSSLVALPELDGNKDGDHGAETTEETNDARVAPSIIGATPLQSEEETDNGRDEDGGTGEVELADAVHERHVDAVGAVAVDVDEEEHDDHGDTTNGKVDVETPAPSGMLSESTSKKRTSNGSNTPHTTDETKCKRTLLKRH